MVAKASLYGENVSENGRVETFGGV